MDIIWIFAIIFAVVRAYNKNKTGNLDQDDYSQIEIDQDSESNLASSPTDLEIEEKVKGLRNSGQSVLQKLMLELDQLQKGNSKQKLEDHFLPNSSKDNLNLSDIQDNLLDQAVDLNDSVKDEDDLGDWEDTFEVSNELKQIDQTGPAHLDQWDFSDGPEWDKESSSEDIQVQSASQKSKKMNPALQIPPNGRRQWLRQAVIANVILGYPKSKSKISTR
ncbi:TPA: hypothetical protein ACGO1T_000611 [Streptococcus suis]